MIISKHKCKSIKEAVETSLKLMEKKENMASAFKKAINKGLVSPEVESFDFDKHLQ